MSKRKRYFLRSVFFWLLINVSVSAGGQNQSLTDIESGKSLAKKYARFVSQDPAMKRIVKLSQGTPERKRTDRLLKNLDWDIGLSRIRFVGNPLAGERGDVMVRIQLPFDLAEGDALTLRYHWTQNPRYQFVDPEASSFVSLSGNSGIKLRYFTRSGIDGGLDSLSSVVGFEVGSQPIVKGSEISFKISNFRLPLLAQSDFDLPVYIEKKGFLELKIPSSGLLIRPSETAKIYISAPSISGLDEKFDASLRFEDKYGNLSKISSLDLDLLTNGIFKKRIQIEQNPGLISDLSFNSTGLNFIEVRTGGGGLRAKSNPIAVGPYMERIQWLDFGPRTKFSEGVLSGGDIINSGKGKYDLVFPVDHQFYNFKQVPNRALREKATLRNSFIEFERSPNNLINVATPERTSRLRFQNANQLKLVQIFSGSSYYPWLLDRFARYGYQVGVLGSQFSLNTSKFENRIYSAVVIDEGSSFIEALTSGSTYVTIDSKIILLNKSKTLSLEDERFLEVEIIGEALIEKVELYKNGFLLDTHEEEDRESDRYNLELYSSSKPFSPVSSRPRNQREWLGRIKIRNGSLSAEQKNGWRVKQTSFDIIEFYTQTHGLVKRLPFKLSNYSEGTEIEILIAEGFESPSWLPVDRFPSQTPPDRFLIPLAEMNGGATRTTRVNGYDDKVEVLPKKRSLGKIFTYSYSDRSVPKLGDYYYFTVHDEKGGVAVSSPIFVSGGN